MFDDPPDDQAAVAQRTAFAWPAAIMMVSVALLVTLILAALSYVDATYREQGVPVEGQLVAATGGFAARYTVQGQPYQTAVRRAESAPADWQAGETVALRCLPDHPEAARFNDAFGTWRGVVPQVLLLWALALYYVVKAHRGSDRSARRRRSVPRPPVGGASEV